MKHMGTCTCEWREGDKIEMKVPGEREKKKEERNSRMAVSRKSKGGESGKGPL